MRILRVAMALSLATGAGTKFAAADVGTIVFQDGARIRGDVTESPAEIVLTTPYGTRRFSRANDASANKPAPRTRRFRSSRKGCAKGRSRRWERPFYLNWE